MIITNYFKKMFGFDANGNGVPTDSPENENNNSNEQTSQEKVNNSENKKARIYNLIIVDESGSMRRLEHATITGVNETINSIRSAQSEFADTQEHFLTLVTFDSHANALPVRTLLEREPINKVKEFTNYHSCGSTPLFDAMGQSITALYRHIKDDDDASAVVTVLTDGLENASREWDARSLKALIEQLKQEGWSFAYMGSAHNVKEVTDLLSIESYVEFSHDIHGVDSTWARESSAKRNFFRKMDMEYRHGRIQSKREWIERKRQMAKEYYSKRVTPESIDTLKQNEIFVFGSNHEGIHNGGAAATAMSQFGAVWGQGEGLQGRSYAIPTTVPMQQMQDAVNQFATFADSHPEMRFLVTRVGCGNAGLNVTDVAPMFRNCIYLENVALPLDFWKVLGLKM